MTRPIDAVVTWKWTPPPGYRSTFTGDAVNLLAAMVRRHYPHPHRFICVTDDPSGISPTVEILPPWDDFASVQSPHGRGNPSCYRRLRAFHPGIAASFGQRFVSLDLDLVITGDLTPLWHRPEDIVLLQNTNTQPGSHYNGSMVLMSAGARPRVWTDFDPDRSPTQALRAKAWGSDQGWISYTLGPSEARWSKKDGIYSFKLDVRRLKRLPENARIVNFHGHLKPWNAWARDVSPWVAEHYRLDAPVPA